MTTETQKIVDPATEKKVEQRFQKVVEQKFPTYEDARVAFDEIAKKLKRSTTQRVRIRRRQDGFGVVTYGPVQNQKKPQDQDD